MKRLFQIMRPGDTEYRLAEAIDPDRLPAHIAVIMDGNGRWARRRSLPRIAGHKAGVAPVRTTVETCARLGIQALTLYAFSAENWKRPRLEVDALWRLLRVYLRRELPEMMEHDIRFGAIGRTDDLPLMIQREIDSTIRATAGNRGLRLNLALNYGGRAEIVDAMNALVDEARLQGTLDNLNVTEQKIAARLYTAGLPDPDLLIRTSGEMRVSNFLLWQIAYAELYVTGTLWPDFGRTELLRAIVEYQKRDRRFGGLTSVPDEEPVTEAVSISAR